MIKKIGIDLDNTLIDYSIPINFFSSKILKRNKTSKDKIKKYLIKNFGENKWTEAQEEIYGNLDRAVGHYRRYEKQFFKKDLQNLTRVNLKFLDGIGYILYYFNKIFFKNETYPSKIKIFLWDKIFTPFTVILDFITNYKFGKCIIAVYKKN